MSSERGALHAGASPGGHGSGGGINDDVVLYYMMERPLRGKCGEVVVGVGRAYDFLEPLCFLGLSTLP